MISGKGWLMRLIDQCLVMSLLLMVLFTPRTVAEPLPSGEPQRFDPAAYLRAKELGRLPPPDAFIASASGVVIPSGCLPEAAPVPLRRTCTADDLTCIGSLDRAYVLGLERTAPDRLSRTPERGELAEQLLSYVRDRCWRSEASRVPKVGFRPELELSLAPGTELNLVKRRGIAASVGISGRF